MTIPSPSTLVRAHAGRQGRASDALPLSLSLTHGFPLRILCLSRTRSGLFSCLLFTHTHTFSFSPLVLRAGTLGQLITTMMHDPAVPPDDLMGRYASCAGRSVGGSEFAGQRAPCTARLQRPLEDDHYSLSSLSQVDRVDVPPSGASTYCTLRVDRSGAEDARPLCSRIRHALSHRQKEADPVER